MIEYRDIKKLKYYAREFAMMMDNADIEAVIAEFVEVKNLRDKYKKISLKWKEKSYPPPP
ncbi:MAG: hypothetical protein FJ123_04185 [Deltaproteobacteria bacterium]|nr:hypothetical protein [Deltaproteobacteria bacterium]